MVLKIHIYAGKSVPDPENLGQSGAVVVHLMEGFLDKGHILYADNYYNSVALTNFMTTKKTYICETLRADRTENPKDVVKKKL